MRGLWDDARFGVRLLARTPGFTAAALITLGLAIGANTVLFSLIDAIFLRPLGVADGSRLVHVYETRNGGGAFPLSIADYFDYRRNARSFENMAAHYPTAPLHVVVNGEPATITGSVVTASYFDVLGLRPSLGRFFLEEEDRVHDRDAVVVISHAFWQQRLEGRSDVLGQTIGINGRTFAIVGVTPPGFGATVQGSSASHLWIPSAMFRVGYRYCADPFARDCTVVQIIARLKRGVALDAARAEMTLLSRQIETAYPSSHAALGVSVVPARGSSPAGQETNLPIVGFLLAGVCMVLLVACANVGGLLLVRGVKRRREVAIRLALGAHRGRVIRQLLTEAALLAAAGGALGVIVAIWANDAVRGFYATDYAGRPLHFELGIRGWVLVATTAISLITAVLAGLLPALLVSTTNVLTSLKDESGTGGPRPSRLRDALVVLQIACAMVLLVGAGLLVRSLQQISRGPGIDTARVIMLRLRPSLVAYEGTKAHAFHREVIRRLEQLPGVVAASPGESLPLFGAGSEVTVSAADANAAGPVSFRVTTSRVGDRYFAVLGLPLLQGREFDSRDLAAGQPVAIINDVLAHRLWPGERAAGRTLRVDERPYEVVGVVRAGQYHAITTAPAPYLYLNYWQQSARGGWPSDSRTHVRVTGDAAEMMPIIRREIAAIDPAVPLSEDYPLSTRVRFEFRQVRMAMTLLVSFAIVAVVLAATGLYGIVAFAMSLRTREIAIRMALGASPDQVRLFIARQGRTVALSGVVLGITAAAAGARVLSTMLYGVQAHDAATFAVAAVLLAGIAALATGVTARRAMRIDPALTLRQE